MSTPVSNTQTPLASFAGTPEVGGLAIPANNTLLPDIVQRTNEIAASIAARQAYLQWLVNNPTASWAADF